MAEYADRERFIPFQKSQIVSLLLEHGLDATEKPKFKEFCKLLQSLYHFQFHEKLELLKDNYFPFNPDTDSKLVAASDPKKTAECQSVLVKEFSTILNNANFEHISEEKLQQAMAAESFFDVSLFVDFDDFSDYLIYARGETTKKVTIKKWIFKTVEVEVKMYERMAMLIRYKEADYFNKQNRKDLMFQPGRMIIKLFKEIPSTDLEMLFPNAQVRMTLKDKLIMLITGFAGGIGVVLKTSAGLLAMAGVLLYMSKSVFTGDSMPTLDAAQITAMVGGVTALGMIIGFLVKQFLNYKNRKIQFMKTLADNLYFKNLDNNVGVFHHLVDSAEEEECKEAMLAYHFLLRSEKGLTEKQLDDTIEKWFTQKHDIEIDFEVDDALNKLKSFELCKISAKDDTGKDVYQAISLDDACTRLDYIWDNYFQYNKK